MLRELSVLRASRRLTPEPFRPRLAEAVRYWSRGTRQSRAWAPHLSHSRGLIDTTIDDFAERRTVVVLGSGPLFEIPLESLARTFEQVVLVDCIHLSAVEPRLARYDNVVREWRDLAAVDDGNPLAFLNQVPGLDWVISANVLTDLAPSRSGRSRHIIDHHLDTLALLSCPVTLITDIDYRVFNRHGVMLDSADLLHGRHVPRSGLRWKWEMAPFGEQSRHTRRVHTVAAWPDWRLAQL